MGITYGHIIWCWQNDIERRFGFKHKFNIKHKFDSYGVDKVS